MNKKEIKKTETDPNVNATTLSKAEKFSFLDDLAKDSHLKRAIEFKKSLEVIPSGCLSLDNALGLGGYLRGTIVDIFGYPSGGKSLLSLMAIKEVQKLGGVAVVVDAERNYSKSQKWMEINGVNPKDMWLIQPQTGEEALDLVFDILTKNAADLIVFDSVPALRPQSILERPLTDGQLVGAQALMMTLGLQKLTGVIDDTRCVCIFINQLRAQINAPNAKYVKEEDMSTGGMALKFYASIRIGVKKIVGSEVRDKNEVDIGHRVRVKVSKNKLAPPNRSAEFSIYYEGGIDVVEDLTDVLLAKEEIKTAGAWYEFDGNRFQGRNKVIAYLKESDRYIQHIEKIRAGFSNDQKTGD